MKQFRKDFERFYKKIQDEFDKKMIFIIENGKIRDKTPEEILKDHLKFARGLDNRIVFVHNETIVAYKTGNYSSGYKLQEPLEIDETFQFDRWATSMDI